MSVSKMEKLTVIAHRDDADAIVRRLMRLHAVSLTEGGAVEDKAPPRFIPDTDMGACAAWVARIEAVIPVLAKHSKRKNPIFAQRSPILPAEFRESGRWDTARKVVEQTEAIGAEMAEIKAALATAKADLLSLSPYLDFNRPLSFNGTETTRCILGSLPLSRRDNLTPALDGLAATVSEISRDKTTRFVVVLTHKSDESAVLSALSGIGFLPASFPARDGTAKQLFDRIRKQEIQLREALTRADARLDILAEKLCDVEILCDLERTTLLAEENKRRLFATKECVILRGWCPHTARAKVEKTLAAFVAATDFSPPEEGDDPPVLLENNGFAKSFEWVVGMYSYPQYGRFDPTFVMSLFYFLIFGLMFADAGYGLVLSAICFFAVAKLHPGEGMKRFLLMFGYCGISSMIFGVLFGAYFGNFPLAFLQNILGVAEGDLPNLSILPAEAANVALLFDPLLNPMAFLILSLAFGALHLIAGMAVKAFLLCREGKPLDALFDIVSYWVLFAGIAMMFIHRSVGIWLLIGGALAILLTQGRTKKGFFGKAVGGLGGLYGLINYASDLLSYSRILALGLAAGVIGQVVNILATLGGPSFIGFILMIVVFIVGHLLNLVINVLGTFVHTSRLQYIEFFGKFYEDGGTPFRPIAPAERFCIDTTPTEINSISQNKGELL